MVKKKIEKKGVDAKTILGIGAGVAALSAAAYILFGPNGKNNRKAIRGWTVKMKGEVIEELEKTKELTESAYNSVVDKIHARYLKFKNVDKKELELLVNDIKKNWKMIKKDLEGKKPKTASRAKK